MGKYNSTWVAAICLIAGLIQPQAVNAQAAQLIQVGAKLLPIVIPMALTSIPIAIKMAPQVPELVRSYLPSRPIKKSKASKDDNASETVIGTVEHKPAVPIEDDEARQQRIAAKKARQLEAVRAARRAHASDNSDWYMEEDEAPPVAAEEKPQAAPMRVEKSVQARVTTPIARPPQSSEEIAEWQAGERAAEADASPPTIMMRVAD